MKSTMTLTAALLGAALVLAPARVGPAAAQEPCCGAQVMGGQPMGGAAALAQQLYDDPRWKENRERLVQLILAENPGLTTAGNEVADDDPDLYEDCVCVVPANTAARGCTGTLIGKRLVLTCGHGYKEPPKPKDDKGPDPATWKGTLDRVYVGLNVKADPNPGKFYEVEKVVRHGSYKVVTNPPDPQANNPKGWTDLEHDLTLLILKEEVSGVTPRPLATPQQLAAAFYVRVVGFGANSLVDGLLPAGFGVKRHVRVPIATYACDRMNPDDRSLYGCLKPFELVASDPHGVADSCEGDSGGPAYIVEGGKHYLAGAVSRTARPTPATNIRCGRGGIYVRVDKYRDWIVQTAQQHNCTIP